MAEYRRIVVSLMAMGVLLLSTPHPVAAKAPSPVRTGTRVVSVRTQVMVRNPTREVVKNLVITLPPTVATQVGQQQVVDVAFSTTPTITRKTPVGIEAVYQIPEVEPGATLVFDQTYTVELNVNSPSLLPEQGGSRYLASEPGIEVDHPAIRTIASAAVAEIDGVDAQAEALIRAVVDRLAYDANALARNQGALAGLESGYGVCQEYASLFVAMARASGLPARLVYGWAKDTGLKGQLTSENRHVWAEYYHPDRGWVSVDPTFAEQQDDLLFFDPAAHIAQDYTNATMHASFGGRGLVSINMVQTLDEVAR